MSKKNNFNSRTCVLQHWHNISFAQRAEVRLQLNKTPEIKLRVLTESSLPFLTPQGKMVLIDFLGILGGGCHSRKPNVVTNCIPRLEDEIQNRKGLRSTAYLLIIKKGLDQSYSKNLSWPSHVSD